MDRERTEFRPLEGKCRIPFVSSYSDLEEFPDPRLFLQEMAIDEGPHPFVEPAARLNSYLRMIDH